MAEGILLDAIDAGLRDRLRPSCTEGYAVLRGGTLLHRAVMERILDGPIPRGREVDHRNLNRLDNRRSNLRMATRQQNSANCSRKSASRFRGVTWDKARGKWAAGVKIDYVRHNLGRFDNEEDAARAYDAAARVAFGEFARLNFPCE